MRFILMMIFACSLQLGMAQTQTEMNEEAQRDYQKTDNELNSVYQQILKDYRSDTAFIKNLKTSQKLWVQFRDAEMKVKYPDREPGYYGSIQPLCHYIYLRELTEARVKTLKLWTEGIEEGDVCSGSVKTQ